MILPGATLGVVGGGQLGRMFVVAARTMGYRVMVLDPDPDSPAGRIADEHLHSAYADEWALAQLVDTCAAVTTEFENVPAAALHFLEGHLPVRPSARALVVTQDRVQEKAFLRERGFPTVAYRVIDHPEQLEAALQEIPGPYILKRSALGYDGKGQFPVLDLPAARAAFTALGGMPCVLEQQVALQLEISVVVARSPAGQTTCFPVAENRHENGILSTTIVPARLRHALALEADEIAMAIAESLGYCGVMAVEFFLTRDGQLLVNEIAPRPHNSGHFTLDACLTSQFEQQVRMVCGLPAGDTRLLSSVVMVNVLGELWTERRAPRWEVLLDRPNVKLHLYGKREARPGRKMGHFCVLEPDLDRAVAEAESLRNALAEPAHGQRS